jgi:uncharacterized protein (TIGR02246 family)
MGTAQEAVMRTLVDCWNTDDRDGAAALYSDDAVFHLVGWWKPLVGRDAIRAYLDDLAAFKPHSTILNMASTDSVVFAEGIDTQTHDGKAVTMHWSIVVEINDAGEITAERDYVDMKELDAQLA